MAVAKKKPVAKKSATKAVTKPKRNVVQDKPWDACTLAGFGIGTQEYLDSQNKNPEDDLGDFEV